jgi:hypothetical protein
MDMLTHQFTDMVMHECRGLGDEYEIMTGVPVCFHGADPRILGNSGFTGAWKNALTFVINND